MGPLLFSKIVVVMSTYYTDRGAVISGCEKYRYLLWREWRTFTNAARGTTLFIMLNPSTADANADDPTIRRCVGFAQSWNHNRLEVVNLFAYRATEPKELLEIDDRVGPLNDTHVREAADRAGVIVCAWGAHGRLDDRAELVRSMLGKHTLHVLRMTMTGQPQHPLYLSKKAKLEVFK